MPYTGAMIANRLPSGPVLENRECGYAASLVKLVANGNTRILLFGPEARFPQSDAHRRSQKRAGIPLKPKSQCLDVNPSRIGSPAKCSHGTGGIRQIAICCPGCH